MTQPAPVWRPTIAVVSAAATVLLLLLLAVALHRPDLVALAAPLAIGPAVHLLRRPAGPPAAELTAPTGAMPEGESAELHLAVSTPPGTDLVTARLVPGAHLALRSSAAVVVVPDAAGAGIAYPVRPMRWGRTRTGRATVTAYSAQGLWQCTGVAVDTGIKIVFGRERFSASDAVPLAAGVVGVHRSRRRGEGTDLAGVRPFVPGDRLKRINWPVSLRTGELHVTATSTDLDATVMIVVDSSVDAGAEADAIGGSLDLAVRAAASIAEHYLHAGDRVGLLDTKWSLGIVPPGTGRRHLERIVDVLVDVDTSPTHRTDVLPVQRVLARIAPRSLVIVISPLVDVARPDLAVAIARSGHPVLVVDSLGDQRPAAAPDSAVDLAWRLQRLEHRRDVDLLTDHGIPVVPWRGSGSLDGVLRSLARTSTRPRVRS
jgi:uncharacterized protein (DUF58 family)